MLQIWMRTQKKKEIKWIHWGIQVYQESYCDPTVPGIILWLKEQYCTREPFYSVKLFSLFRQVFERACVCKGAEREDPKSAPYFYQKWRNNNSGRNTWEQQILQINSRYQGRNLLCSTYLIVSLCQGSCVFICLFQATLSPLFKGKCFVLILS